MALPGADWDPYAVLGVSPDATREEIEAAWRRALRACHPDRHPDDPDAGERVRQVLEAGQILRDPQRRARLDRVRRLKAQDARRATDRPQGSQGRPFWTTLAWDGAGEPADEDAIQLPGGLRVTHRRGR